MLNADDERVARFAEVARGRVIRFGTGAGRARNFARRISKSAASKARRSISFRPAGRARLELPLIGRHNVMNALAALAAASVWGIGAAEAQQVFPDAAAGGQARRSGALRGRIYGDQRLATTRAPRR